MASRLTSRGFVAKSVNQPKPEQGVRQPLFRRNEMGQRLGDQDFGRHHSHRCLKQWQRGRRADRWRSTQAGNGPRSDQVHHCHAWTRRPLLLPYLKVCGRGRIINIASQAGVVAIAEHATYAASKAGLIGLTKVLALEWAQYGVTVNAISPTVVETPMAMVGWSGERGEKARKEIPVGRFAKPSEIAWAAVYLASREAAIITVKT